MVPIRIVVADDHVVVREGLRGMLRGDPRVQIVGEAADQAEMLAAVAGTQPDIVLLDVRLQGQSGLDVCRAVLERFPDVRVVFLTANEEPHFLFESLRAGARGYLLKHVSGEELVRTLQHVRDGRIIVDQVLTGQVALRAAAFSGGAAWPGAQIGLSERQSQVLQAMTRGLSNAAIASELFISDETVKTHVRSILRKLGVADRTQAVAAAFKGGLVS